MVWITLSMCVACNSWLLLHFLQIQKSQSKSNINSRLINLGWWITVIICFFFLCYLEEVVKKSRLTLIRLLDTTVGMPWCSVDGHTQSSVSSAVFSSAGKSKHWGRSLELSGGWAAWGRKNWFSWLVSCWFMESSANMSIYVSIIWVLECCSSLTL